VNCGFIKNKNWTDIKFGTYYISCDENVIYIKYELLNFILN